MKPKKPRVYSYIRFSTPEQKLGDSEQRQVEKAKEYATEKKLLFDETIKDEGVSGFHGTNRKKGALGQFLKRIEAGEIPKGSVLVVENIDRLGREDVLTALATITTIIERGISIVTLSPFRAEYTRQSINQGLIYELVGTIKRANGESQIKSERIQSARNAARKKARESGRMMTAQVPAWFNKEKAKEVEFASELELVPKAKQTVRRIFKLKLQGIGTRGIAEKLNQAKGWKRPNGWRKSYVCKILNNRAVIGEYQPHVTRNGKRKPTGDAIENYYPSIVDRDDFFAVQKLIKNNKGQGGRKDRCGNLFTSLVVCGYCGGAMQYVNKGALPKGYVYLQCSNGYRAVCCERHSIRYDEVEKVILENCHKLQPKQVLPDPDALSKVCNSLQKKINSKEAELGDTEKQIENFIDQIGKTKSANIRNRYEKKIERLEQNKTEIQALLQQLEIELNNASKDSKSLGSWKKNLKELSHAIENENSKDIRLRLRLHLQEFIERIEVFAVGHKYPPHTTHRRTTTTNTKKNGITAKRRVGATECDLGADDFLEYMEALVTEDDAKLWKNKTFRQFLKQIAEERKTKKGRFVRVRFQTGAIVDLVPENSLASGSELVQNGTSRQRHWRTAEPDIEQLWLDYQKNNKTECV